MNFIDVKRKKCRIKSCKKLSRSKLGLRYCNEHYQKYYFRKNKDKVIKRLREHSLEPKYRYKAFKRYAKDKKIKFQISLKYFEKLISLGCNYCNVQLNGTGGSLDRIIAKEGYVDSNVLPCCWNCNRLKSDHLKVEETLEIIKLLRKLRKKDNIWEKEINNG